MAQHDGTIQVTFWIPVVVLPDGAFDETTPGGLTSAGFEWIGMGLHQDRYGPAPRPCDYANGAQ
jgi:hypothetical protein